MTGINANWRNSKFIIGLVLAKLVHSVRAEGTSGAVIWWIIFTMCSLAAGTGYLVYLQYVQKKPLGKNHPNYVPVDNFVAEEAKRRTPGDRKPEEEKDIRNPMDKNKKEIINRNMKQNVSKPVARPEDVKLNGNNYRYILILMRKRVVKITVVQGQTYKPKNSIK
jgi:hypothetical protein